MPNSTTSDGVQHILSDRFSNRIYSVEDGLVWVSGANQHCESIARRMADTLVREGIPCSLVHSDGSSQFGGVQFRYGDNA